MFNGIERQGKRLAKASLAKTNTAKVDVTGIAGDTIARLDSLSQSFGVTYDVNNNILTNNVNDELQARDLHGVISGMNVSINVNPRYFDIASGVYYIDGTRVEFPATTVDTVSIIGGEFASVIIDSGKNVTLIPNGFPSSTQLKDGYLELTAFSKLDVNTIDKIGDSFFTSYNFVKKVYLRNKLFEGTIFDKNAGLITKNAINPLMLDIDGGDYNTPDLDTKTITATTQISAETMYHVSGVYSIQPEAPLVVDVVNYDNGTDLVPIPNNKYVVHTISRSSRTNTIYMTYGKIVYNKLTDATSASYDLGSFAGYDGNEVEPISLLVIDQRTASIIEIIDIRNKGRELITSSSVQDTGWKDSIIPFGIASKGSSAPAEVNDVNGWRRLSFNIGDTVYADFHVNHDYLKGSKAYPHVHWIPTTTMAIGETVSWTISYIIARGHQQGESLLGTPTVITFSYTADGTEIVGEHIVTECSDAQAFDLLEPDTVISVKVERTTGTYASAVYGLMMGIHYQSNSDATLNKAPDFYA